MFPFNSWKAAIVHEDSRGSGEEGIQGLRIRKNPRTARHFHGPNASVVLKENICLSAKIEMEKNALIQCFRHPPQKKDSGCVVSQAPFMVLGDDSTYGSWPFISNYPPVN